MTASQGFGFSIGNPEVMAASTSSGGWIGDNVCNVFNKMLSVTLGQVAPLLCVLIALYPFPLVRVPVAEFRTHPDPL